jgi:hypothetical protein
LICGILGFEELHRGHHSMQPQLNHTTFSVTTDAGKQLRVSVVSGEACSASDIESDLKGDLLVEPLNDPAAPSALGIYTATPIRNTLVFMGFWVVVLIIGFFSVMMIDLFIDMAKLGDGLTPGRLRLLAQGWLFIFIMGVIIYLAPVLIRSKSST